MRLGMLCLAFALSGCGLAGPSGGPPMKPRYDTVVTIYFGGCDSRCSGSATIPALPHTSPDRPTTAVPTGKLKFGPSDSGKFTEVEWYFLGHRGDKDAYRMIHRFAANGRNTTEETAEVEFGGARVKVFENEHDCVVIGGVAK